MNYIYWLSQIQHEEKYLVGNRLYILSQLLQHECSILPGFVLGNNLLRRFLTDLADFRSLLRELSESSFHLDVNDYAAIQSVASRSRQTIDRAVFPEDWQGAISQAARQLNSDGLILQPYFFLLSGQDLEDRGLWRSHTCSVDPQAIGKTIKKVWSQLFSANSLLYWNKLGLSGEKVNLAILVKPLRPTYASGIVEVGKDLLRIKSVWGLELSLLQGDVEPDRYCLDRHTGKLLDRYLGHKNYGYRVKTSDRQSNLTECTEAYIPDETRAQAYVLSQSEISLLLPSLERILRQQPQIEYLFWTAPEPRSGEQLKFWFTQFGEQLLVKYQSSPDAISDSLSLPGAEALLTGISAAPGSAVGSIVVIEDLDKSSHLIPTDLILVTKEIHPHQIPLIKQVKGVITEEGGKTSHAAIVARELKIPAIVNAIDATSVLEDGSEVLLDGSAGKIYPATAARKLELRDSTDRQLSVNRQLIATKLMVNVSQPESIESIVNLPVDGVGLVRAELLLGNILVDTSPAEWKSPSFQSRFKEHLRNYLHQLTVAFAPRPVYYRSLDRLAPDARSPILGKRGTYSYYFDSVLFSLELEILQEIATQGRANIHLILPFVRGVEEFKFCYRQLQDIGLLDKESFQVWIMAEVPSVVWLLPEYVRAGVRGIAIGTNDLTQLILGVDRRQASFDTHGLNANHPAVQKAIAQLIAMAKKYKIDCCLCGQAAVEHPSSIDKLIDWGITSISVEPSAVETTYREIARAERRILLESLRNNS